VRRVAYGNSRALASAAREPRADIGSSWTAAQIGSPCLAMLPSRRGQNRAEAHSHACCADTLTGEHDGALARPTGNGDRR
jgi:hypothetical protein